MHKNKRDNWVDMAGYARVGYLTTKEPTEPAVSIKLTKKEINKL